jgi:hypothetical protein
LVGLHGLPDHTRHQPARTPTDILPHFYADDFCRVHLLIQKLGHPPKLNGQRIGYKHEPHPTRPQVRLHARPELIGIGFDPEEKLSSSAGSIDDCAHRSSKLARRPRSANN